MIRIRFSELKIGDTFMTNHHKKFIKTNTVATGFLRVKINCVLLEGVSAHPRGTLMSIDPDVLINKMEE